MLTAVAATTAATDGSRSGLLGCSRAERFDADDFPARPLVDNPFLPLVPGTQLVLRGVSNVVGPTLDHEVVFTVTDLTKRVAGVRSVVAYDVDVSDGEVTEAELAFFAQDEDGNVWSLGEYPEEFEDGEFVGAPSTWIAGEDGAEAGVHMLAAPRVRGLRYLQGRAPEIDFLDCAEVVADDEVTGVPAGRFTGVLVTEETSPLEPDSGSQLKHHAPGLGIVLVTFVDDPEGEVLELADFRVLRPGQLGTVRREALELDDRAYEVSDVYASTSRAKRLAEDLDAGDRDEEDQAGDDLDEDGHE